MLGVPNLPCGVERQNRCAVKTVKLIPMEEVLRVLKKLTKLKENLQDLTEKEAYTFFKAILEGRVSSVKTAAFLTAMRIKGETSQELLGVIRAIRERMKALSEREDAVDLAPNYDGKDRTLYILPSALWMVSSFGVSFTNHYALGVPTKEGVTLFEVCKVLELKDVVTFADQRDFAPDLCRLMPLRRELGFRSLINTVEKFLNPFGCKRIIVSVFHKPFFEKNEALLELLGFEDYAIVKGLEGGLEPPPDRPFMFKRKGEELKSFDPKKLGIALPKDVSTDDVLGESVKVNAHIVEGTRKDEFFNWACYTAGFILFLLRIYPSIEEATEEVMKRFS